MQKSEKKSILCWTSAFLYIISMSIFRFGQIAQLVEQRTENPRVGGSIPSLTTNKKRHLRGVFFLLGIIRERKKDTQHKTGYDV